MRLIHGLIQPTSSPLPRASRWALPRGVIQQPECRAVKLAAERELQLISKRVE